jgi:hypothetical protein
MPTTRKRTRRQGLTLTQAQIDYLLTGFLFTGCEYPFKSKKQERDLWNRFKSQIVELHVSENPGSRPWAWWKYEAKGKKLKVIGKGSYLNPKKERVVFDVFEQSYDFLKRHGLLLKDEQRPKGYWTLDKVAQNQIKAHKKATRKKVIGVNFQEKTRKKEKTDEVIDN